MSVSAHGAWYPLADILQMTLETEGDKVYGILDVSVIESPVRFRMEVVSSYKQDRVAGLLCKVKGKLFMFMGWDGSSNYGCMLVDADKLGSVPSRKNPVIPSSGTADKVYAALEKGVVASFSKGRNEISWTEIK